MPSSRLASSGRSRIRAGTSADLRFGSQWRIYEAIRSSSRATMGAPNHRICVFAGPARRDRTATDGGKSIVDHGLRSAADDSSHALHDGTRCGGVCWSGGVAVGTLDRCRAPSAARAPDGLLLSGSWAIVCLFVWIDTQAGLPTWWMLMDGVGSFAAGAVLLWACCGRSE